MASKAKKLSVMKIRKICVSGKALREEAILERVSGELAGIPKVYLNSCNGEFESIKCCSTDPGFPGNDTRIFMLGLCSKQTFST